jgi:hypothetical protein
LRRVAGTGDPNEPNPLCLGRRLGGDSIALPS